LKTKFPGMVATVTSRTQGRSKNLTVTISQVPRTIQVFSNGFLGYVSETGDTSHMNFYDYTVTHEDSLDLDVRELLSRVKGEISSWQRKETDHHTDLYNTNFFAWVTVDMEDLKKKHLAQELRQYEVEQGTYF